MNIVYSDDSKSSSRSRSRSGSNNGSDSGTARSRSRSNSGSNKSKVDMGRGCVSISLYNLLSSHSPDPDPGPAPRTDPQTASPENPLGPTRGPVAPTRWRYQVGSNIFYRYSSVDIYFDINIIREGGTAKCCGQASFGREHAELWQREEQEAAEGERAEAVLQAAVGHQQEPRPGTVCSNLDININTSTSISIL